MSGAGGRPFEDLLGCLTLPIQDQGRRELEANHYGSIRERVALGEAEGLAERAYGGGRLAACGPLLWQGIWLALGLGVPLAAFLYDAGWLLEALGQRPAVTAAAADYLRGRALAVG